MTDPTNFRRETRRITRRFGRQKGNLIPALQMVQASIGYLPKEAMLEIADIFNIEAMDVYSVVTFYNQFRNNPPGNHSVKVCLGTACHMKGGYISLDAWKRRLNIESGQVTDDHEFDLDTVACVGCCTMAPVSVVDDKPEAKVDPSKVDGILLSFELERKRKSEESRKTS